jgi:hypothetical protein
MPFLFGHIFCGRELSFVSQVIHRCPQVGPLILITRFGPLRIHPSCVRLFISLPAARGVLSFGLVASGRTVLNHTARCLLASGRSKEVKRIHGD